MTASLESSGQCASVSRQLAGTLVRVRLIGAATADLTGAPRSVASALARGSRREAKTH